MARKTCLLILPLIVVLAQTSFAFTDNAIVLSDYELDQIHAGGLNLNFDNFLGSVNQTVGSGVSPVVSVSTPTNPFLVNPNNPNVLVNSPALPSAPQTPNSAATPNVPTVPVNPLNSFLPNGVNPPSGVPAGPVSPVSPVGTEAVLPSTSNILSPIIPDNPVTPNTSFGPEIPILPIDPINPISPNVPTESIVSPLEIVAPVNPSTASAPVSPVNPATPASPASPAGVTPPTQPTQSNSPLVLDVLASNDGGFKVAVGENSGVNPIPFSVSGGGFNSINVSDSSQQNLSALVNVNAAGSIVPVQINLTVLYNSTVETITNNNALDLTNFTTLAP